MVGSMIARTVALGERALLTLFAFLLLSIAPPVGSAPPAWRWGGIAEAASGPFTLNEVTIGGALYTLTFRKLTLEGSELSEAETRKLFAADAVGPLSERLQRLTFAKGRAEEAVETVRLGPSSSTTRYRDVTLTNVVFGHADTLAAAGGATESVSEVVRDGETRRTTNTGELGALKVTGLDLVALAKFVGDATVNGVEPFFPLYKTYHLDGYKMAVTTPEAGEVAVRIGPIDSRDVKVRPSSQGIGSAIALLSRSPDLDRLGTEDRIALIQSIVGTIASIDLGPSSARDIVLEGRVPQKDGPDAGKLKPFRLAIAAVENDTAKRSLVVSGLGFEAPEDRVSFSIGRYAFEGFSAEPTLQMLGLMADNGTVSDEDFENVDPRDLMPGLGSITISDVKLATPEPQGTFSIGVIKLAFADQLRGVPTRLSFAIEHFVMALPADTKTPEIRTLRQAGLEKLDVSAGFAAQLDQQGKTINLGGIHLDEVGLGSIDLSGSIGNAQPELFTASRSTAQILALALTAKSLKLKAVDQGGVDILAKLASSEQKKSPDEVKTQFLATLADTLSETFGNQPQIERVNSAVRKFVAGAKTLSIVVKAKNELGLGFMDAVTAQSPAEVLKKVEIEASAD